MTRASRASAGSCATRSPSRPETTSLRDRPPRGAPSFQREARHDPDPDPPRHRGVRRQRLRRSSKSTMSSARGGPSRGALARVLRGARRQARGRARAPRPDRRARLARARVGHVGHGPRLDQGRALGGLLGGSVCPELRAGDQSRLLGRLEPGGFRRSERRARPVRQGTQCLLAKIAVFAGDLPPLCHRLRGRPSYGRRVSGSRVAVTKNTQFPKGS